MIQTESKSGTPPRATYTSEQLDQYFDTIRFPAKYRKSSIISTRDAASAPPQEALTFLSHLIKYQIAGIPWENLDLHYSTHHTISVDPHAVFEKTVARRAGRGGYCMENTLLLGTVMRSLGYDVMTTGARVNTAIQPISQSPSWNGPSFDGWNHMVTIVTIGGKKYLVDVGVGSHGPVLPVPLEEDGFSTMNVKPSHEIRLRREHIPDNSHRTNPEQLLWVYSLRFSAESDWLPGYCFSEVEFLPQDYETMNFFVSRSPKSWFTYHVVCLKFLMDEESEEIVGDITLFGRELNDRRMGKGNKIATVASEEERVEALEKYLGVKLSAAEKAGIHGMVTMI